MEPGQQILVPITTEYLSYWLEAPAGTTTYRFSSETHPPSIAMSAPSTDTYSFSLREDYYEYYSYFLSAGTNVSFSWNFAQHIYFSVYRRGLAVRNRAFRDLNSVGSGQFTAPADDMYLFEAENLAKSTNDGTYTLAISRPVFDVPSTAEVLTGGVRGVPSASSTIYLLVTPPAEACSPKYCKISLVEYCSNAYLIIAIVFCALGAIVLAISFWVVISVLPARQKAKEEAAKAAKATTEMTVVATTQNPLGASAVMGVDVSAPAIDPAAPGKLGVSIDTAHLAMPVVAPPQGQLGAAIAPFAMPAAAPPGVDSPMSL
ncbi:hypothetical protein PAPYR_5554 [Paratrimastix pyriformis]|uniref:Uncharacterized protein n=1 Tax=Paratrimastix pyriformis TaxID=342808 RepID=A0ABQ8UIF3_9EUKA|nr:hypothetical protein PAPYR_5554 [Paratrimastix pyriformis]